jgi:MSHA biogenesis protein MshP
MPNIPAANHIRLPAGFALPAAIFLLVVLGSLAAWLMRMTQSGLAADALELEGERTYQAAQSGLEAGIYAARQAGATCASVTQNVTFSGHLSRFTASVSCTSSTADEGGTTRTFFAITSVACNQPDAGACPNTAPTLLEYSERRLAATVESAS